MNNKIFSRIIFLSILTCISSLSLVFQSCEQDFITPGNSTTYPDGIAAIFNEPLNASNITCASPTCHGGNAPLSGLSLDDWSKTMQGSENGTNIIPYNAYWSYFASVLNNDTNNTQVASVTEIALPEYHKIDPAKLQTIVDWINNGAPSKNGEIAFTNLTNKTFIGNQADDKIAILNNDPGSFLVTRMIPVGTRPGPGQLDSPHYLEINPDRTHLFVSLIVEGTVEKYDVNVDYPFPNAGRIQAGLSPAHIVITPDGSKAFVTNFDASVGGVTKFNPITMSQSEVQTLDNVRFRGTHGMDIDEVGNFIYVTSQVSEFLFRINIMGSNFEIQDFVPVDPTVPPNGNGTGNFRPYQVRMSEDDQYIFVSCNGPTQNNNNDIVKVFRTSDLSFVKDITVGNNPILMEFTPDGRYLFVCNKNKNAAGKYTVSIIDVASQTLIHTVEDAGIQPHGVAFTPGGEYAIISCETLEGFDGHHPTVGTNNIGVSRVIRVSDFSLLDIRIQMGSFPSGIVTY